VRWLQYAPVRILVALAPIVALLIAGAMAAPALDLDGAIVNLGLAAGTMALYIGYVRRVEHRRVDELGGTGAVAELARGVVLGALLFAATIAVLCAVGACTIERGGSWAGALRVLAGAAAAAVTEEILLRAILFRIVERSLGTWIALALSAAVFGLLHAFNPGATVASTLAIALEAGILLAGAFVLTRRLWMAFGLHMAWNFTEGGVFGASVSGGHAHGLLASRFHGGSLLTGGAFGPEASIVAVVICLFAGIAVLIVAHRRGQIVPRSWRR
jgi:membrane protease YdiL (CAAX protease family)